MVCCNSKKTDETYSLHLCLKVCDKPLPCGKHKCDKFCHIG